MVFALSLRHGVGGRRGGDVGLMAVAGVGLVGWVTLDEPVIATGFVIVADLAAVVMMLPKTWREPHSETASTFLLAALGGVPRLRQRWRRAGWPCSPTPSTSPS